MAASRRLAASSLRLLRSAPPTASRPFTSTARLAKEDPWAQKTPLGSYYESIIQEPTPYPFKEKPENPPDSAAPEVQPPEKKPEPKKPTTEKPEPEKTTAEKPAPEKPAPEKPAPEKFAPEKPAPEKPAPEKPAPEKPAPEKPASKPEPKTEPEKVERKRAQPKKSQPKKPDLKTPESAPSPTTRGTKKKPGRKPAATKTTPPARATTSSASPPAPTPPPSSAAEKARIIFGSRLLGPAEQAERIAAKESQSTYVAGVLVPPRPEEPDNCCMSGCVNCVWDRYRDEVEEWSAKKNEAQARLAERGGSTVDADGGGSKSNWGGVMLGDAKIAKDLWDEDVFESVPVGIREFMKQEKRLREKHHGQGA